MKYTKKQLLEDDKFKIGFEFEFVAYDLKDVLEKEHFRKLKISEMFFHELDTCFHVSAKDAKTISNILEYAERNTACKTNRYIYSVNNLTNYGTERMVALLRLKPTQPLYRKIGGNNYKDVTAEIVNKIESTDNGDSKQVEKLSRVLRKCYASVPVLGNYVSIPTEVEDHLYKVMVREFKRYTGFQMKRVQSYSTDTKKKHRWYLTEEYVDDITEDSVEYGFEIVSPPLHPVEAIGALRKTLDFMSSDEIPFKIRTGKDCGLHVNISHEDKTIKDVRKTFYGLMFDELTPLKTFSRTTRTMCAPARPLIVKEIKRLVREGAITLDGLNDTNTRTRVLDIIESYTDPGSMDSARFSNLQEWGYIEYRMAGGKNYETRYPEIEKYIIDLLRFTKRYDARNTSDTAFLKKVRDIMVSAGARSGTGLSIIESLPGAFALMPKTKRSGRPNTDVFLSNRDM